MLNPTQLLAQSRDGTRIQDLADINNAIKQYLADNNTNLGTSSVVYVSIPDTNSSCSDLGLPSLPTGWSYHCVSTSTLTETNGNGWIPISFSSITTGNPLPTIPIDPQNTTSTGEYYTYATNGSQYELTSYFESNNYQTQAAQSGNPDPTTYALGSNLDLTPFVHGLVGYWPLNNASGGLNSNTADLSGWGDYGTLQDTTSTGIGPTYESAGCVSGGCLSFDGVDDRVELNNISTILEPIASGTSSPSFSLVAWVNLNTGCPIQPFVIAKYGWHQGIEAGSCNSVAFILWNSSNSPELINKSMTNGVWHFLVGTWNSATGVMDYYVDGSLVGSTVQTSLRNYGTGPFFLGGGISNGALDGLMDNVYVYNIALTSAQIQAIYNSEKP